MKDLEAIRKIIEQRRDNAIKQIDYWGKRNSALKFEAEVRLSEDYCILDLFDAPEKGGEA